MAQMDFKFEQSAETSAQPGGGNPATVIYQQQQPTNPATATVGQQQPTVHEQTSGAETDVIQQQQTLVAAGMPFLDSAATLNLQNQLIGAGENDMNNGVGGGINDEAVSFFCW